MAQKPNTGEPMALVVDAEKCTGCTTCALVCSVVHEGRFGYERSRIRIWRDDARGLFVPLVCEHCEDAPCIAVCPTGALYRDEAGRVLRNAVRCIGCSECMNACPLGAISFNPDQKWIKCDACAGVGETPYCATYCTAQAIRWVPKRLVAREKARETALRRVSAATAQGGDQ